MKQLAEWYNLMLGINYTFAEVYNCCYTTFYDHPVENPSAKRYLAWRIMDLKENYS